MTERASPMSERTERIARALYAANEKQYYASAKIAREMFDNEDDKNNTKARALLLAPLVERAIEAAARDAASWIERDPDGQKHATERAVEFALKALEGKP